MSETTPQNTPITDPSLTTGNDLAHSELAQRVGQVIEYFNNQFGLTLDETGNLQAEPTAEQLKQLNTWHIETSNGGIIMPDMDTFTAKMVLARALMPQRDESGNITYLFGKGAGAELVLQGDVVGRVKKTDNVPFRTHSDFEIYGVAIDNYEAMPHGERFKAVFGPQEIYPVGETKGLSKLPPDYLHKTAETVNYGGLDFLVPCLELQFVDKFEVANKEVEQGLRGKTDAEWLAAAYSLDNELVHSTIDDYVITPVVAEFQAPKEVAEHNSIKFHKMFERAKIRIQDDLPLATDVQLGLAASNNEMLMKQSLGMGINDITELIDSETGQLVGSVTQLLVETETKRQASVAANLQDKHQQVEAILQAA